VAITEPEIEAQSYPVWKPELCADELVVGGGVGWSYDRRRRRAAHFSSAAAASAASDRMREHWNSALAGQAFFPGFTWVSHFTCDIRWAAGAEKLTVNMHAVHNFHSCNELNIHCLIPGGSHKRNVECWGDADGAGVEHAALENVEIKNMASV